MDDRLTVVERVKCWAAGIVLLAVCMVPVWALKTAAGGGPRGRDGFGDLVNFIDNIVTYGIWVVAALATLGGLAGAGKLAIGDEDGTTWLVRSGIGLALGLLIKGITA